MAANWSILGSWKQKLREKCRTDDSHHMIESISFLCTLIWLKLECGHG